MPLPKSKSQNALEKLWRFEGREADFWVELLREFSLQIEAASGMVLIKGESQADKPATWSAVAIWPEAEETKQRFAGQREALCRLADKSLRGKVPGLCVDHLTDGIRGAVMALRLEATDQECVAVFLRYGDEDFFHPSERMVRLMADTPIIYGADPLGCSEAPELAPGTGEPPLATALGLGLLLNEEKHFLAAAMRLCNELATSHSADRVTLGWQEGHYIRIRATNHAEKIDRKMESVRLLASAMEECLDQDDEICWPGNGRSIDRDHECYARKAGVPQLASVPLRLEGMPVAVATLERVEAFTDSEMDALRLSCDLVARRLDDLKQRDRWVGARMASAVRKGLGHVFGVSHTWTKVGVLSALGLLSFLILYPWPYRIEASFLLEPEEVYHLPAPFEGYIEKVNVRAGDPVKAGSALVEMDKSELELQHAELSATVERYLAEAQLARSEATLAEMHIAASKAEETRAELKKVQFNLGLATVKAPVDSYVVEGDLRERIGAPVTKGEALLKLSKLEGMFAELRISEKDIPRVGPGTKGEAVFTSRPELHFPIELTEIEPLAVAEESGNMLVARTRFSGEAPDWWRPGMSGVAKLDCGERSLLWIFTHRAVDYLRMRFWF